MTARTAASFLGALARSNLLSPRKLARIERAVAEAGLEERPDLVARGLEQAGLLTPWQAKQLLHGRRAFFLGPYKLLSRIGAGGMGTVFKAERTPDGKVVALKVVPQERLAAPGAAARFKREMQAAVRLKHRHIVRAYQAERIADFHFLVMEYIDGADLSWYARRAGKLPIPWSCECVRQAAVGLQFAHEKGLVHRDVKPANLLVTIDKHDGSPWVRVVDFGLARFTSEAAGENELTGSGQILGTPDYIAPEQARRTRTADIRADVFSLGCTLFRMVGGRVPFEGETPIERLLARYTYDAPLLRSVRPDVPEELEAVVARMLARDPAGRFATPGEAAAALQPFAMNPSAAIAAAGSSLDLTGGLPRGPLEWERESLAVAEPDEHGDDGDERRVWDEPERVAERTSPFLEMLGEAHEGTQPNDGPTHPSKDAPRLTLDPSLVSGPNAPRWRAPDWLWPAVFALAVVVTAAVFFNLRPTHSGAGRTANSGRSTAPVEGVRRPASGTALPPRVSEPPHATPLAEATGGERIPGPPRPEFAPVAPDATARSDQDRLTQLGKVFSKLLPYYPEARLREAMQSLNDRAAATPWDAAQLGALADQWQAVLRSSLPAELRRATFDLAPSAVFGDLRFTHGGEISVARFSRDGRRLATADRSGLVRVWDAQSGELLREFDASPNVYELSFSATGERLAALGYTDVWDDALEVWDLRSGNRNWAQEGGDDAPLGMAFDPRDDERLWCGDAQGRLIARNTQTGETLSTTQAHPRLLACLKFVGTEGLLATAGADGLKLWRTQSDVQPVRTLHAFGSETLLLSRWSLAVDAAGTRVAFLGPDQRLWIAPVSGEPTASELPFQDGQAQDVAFSPNGDQILVWGRRAGTLRAWSLSRNAFVAPPGARSEDGAAVAVGHVQGVLALGQGGRVRLVDSLSGDDVLPATACRGRILALAAPESGGLVAVDQEGRVCRWRGPTDPPVVRRFVGGSRFVAAKLSLDGSRLLFASPDGRLSIVDLFADGAPRTLATGLDPRDPLALSQDGRWAGWIERRPAEPVTVVVAETGGAERGTFSLSGIPSGLGFAQIGDEMNAVAAAIPGRSPRSASGEPDRREAELVIGGRSGLVKSFALPDSPRLGWLTAFGDLGAVGYGRARLAVWNLAEGRRRLDRDLGEPPIAASFDPSSPRRVIVALANARLLGLDSAAGGAASLDLSRASSAATFARPQVVVEPERGDVLISDDNGVVYRFPWP